MTTATSLRTARSEEGKVPFMDRIVEKTFRKVSDDPACREAKDDTQAFFAANPDRTFHLRPACEAEFNLFLIWPDADMARFVLTRKYSATFQMEWYVTLLAEMPAAVLTDDGLDLVWRVVVPESQRAQARHMAAKQRRLASDEKKRRPFRR